MASRLASGPASEAWLNSTTPSGSSPRVATPWAERKSRSSLRGPSCGGRHHTSQATPAKLSQNPACSTASGSASTIASTASASACQAPSGRRPMRAPATTAIISNVRTVGNENPATAAYPAAPASATRAAACGRGSQRPRRGHSHHSGIASQAKNTATMPTWNPEMAIRWVSPTARKRSQSASSRLRVSPSASARTKREDGEATAAVIRAAIASRQASMPAAGASSRADSGARTWPLAAMRCASAWRPASKPPGLDSPRGARSFTANSQRAPGCRPMRGPGSNAP